GQIALPVRISSALRPGEVFATFHDPGRQVNLLTSPFKDSKTNAPEYKITAVQIRKAHAA
ncbi:MAG TPA: molybdopterin dinucleotide binding domain-containing protein, partial [Candidatus Limnocylindrales bacterium]|nr:molybdopterin dinucleotide binding domain-containing protein [Candidatus Limnocylindrales bacterium]